MKSSQKQYANDEKAGALDLQIVTKHYAVQGQDYRSLVNSLRVNGPKGFHGLASWRINYEYTDAPRGKSCQVNSVLITVTGEILMPRWTDELSAPPALQRRWNDYYAALKRHEDGHIQHGRELALLVKERLMGMSAEPCERLPALAQQEFDRLYGNLKARDSEYDARTNHGATQGALFQ